MPVETLTCATSAGPSRPHVSATSPTAAPTYPAPAGHHQPRAPRRRGVLPGGTGAAAPGRDTVTTAATDLVWSGFLEGGRGVAGAASAAFLPGRRSDHTIGTRVEIRTVSGQQATDRAGAAAHLGIPLNTVRAISAPGKRAETGFPAPLPERHDRRDWFALDDLDRYQAARTTPATPPPVGDPDELLGVAQFAQLRGVTAATITSYVQLSLNDWEQHRDGYLPYPADFEAARNGSVYRWTRRQAVDWAFPAKRRTGGRTAGPAPTAADLQAVLDAAGGTPLKNREIAAALTERLGRPVSLQIVKRLNRKTREQNPTP